MNSETGAHSRPTQALSSVSGMPVVPRERDDRNADRAERDRRRVREQADARGEERREAESGEHRGGNRHRRAESRGAFDERAERERDQHRLQPAVGRSGRRSSP